MSSKNDITGDTIASKPGSDAYRANFDIIFTKKPLLTDEQQKAMDDMAGLEEVNDKS